MKKIEGFANMLSVLEKEKNIPKDMLISAVEAALLSASKKKFRNQDNLFAKLEADGSFKVFAKRVVASTVEDEELQISPEDAKKINPEAEEGSEVEVEVTPADLGRMAAQTAKQVIMQRIREAEKELSFEEFSKKQGELVNGIVQQREFNGYLINLGRIEVLLPFTEMPLGETLRNKDRVKLFVVEVNKNTKGQMIMVSRTHPGLIRKLFELEVPELSEGVLEIKNIVREAGRRTKIAIQSRDPNVSVVGTCVGHMGARIQNIVREIGNERIDIIEWREEPKAYITNALSPAKPIKIDLNKDIMTASVMVPDSQLSLAIGKEGQNVRLASKLTGWKIDISSETGEKKTESAEAKPAEPKAEGNPDAEEKVSGSGQD